MNTITDTLWEALFLPITISPLDDSGLLDAIANGMTHRHVWTVVDGEDGTTHLLPGLHIVNRIGYHLTQVPWTQRPEIEAVICD
jgi:hypothetical protein